MARTARVEGGTAERLAARRRVARERTPARGTPAAKKKAGRGPSTWLRLFKLAVLIGAFLLIGFFVVLVMNGAASVLSRVELSGGRTVAELFDKVVDRVLDRDVPRVEPAPRRAADASRRPRAETSHGRAPVPAARPEDDAQHVEPRADPEVERAKQRLDELLRRL